MDNDFLSANEFAKCLGIHYNTVRDMIKKGKLNSFKIGRAGRTSDIRIPRSEIQRLSIVNLEKIVDDLVEERINNNYKKQIKSFEEKIEKTDSCWLWKAAKSKSGYGVFSLNRKWMRAHRASYTIYKGPIPDGLLVLHSCDTPDCVNPDHLSLGTPKKNMDEMRERGRERKRKGNDHPCCKITDEQAQEIRELRKQKVPAKEIAKKFNISFEYVYQIAKGLYR